MSAWYETDMQNPLHLKMVFLPQTTRLKTKMPSTIYLVTIHIVFETKDSHLEPPKGEEVLKLLEAMFAKSKEYWTVGDSRTK